MTWSAVGLGASTLLASAVEVVEALTIVLAMGLTRSWRAALIGTSGAIALLAITALSGTRPPTRLPGLCSSSSAPSC